MLLLAYVASRCVSQLDASTLINEVWKKKKEFSAHPPPLQGSKSPFENTMLLPKFFNTSFILCTNEFIMHRVS